MKRTPLRRGTKEMKRSGFARKPQNALQRKNYLKALKGRVRVKIIREGTNFKKLPRKKSELSKLKDKLWELCKQITRKQYGNVCYTCGQRGLEGYNWHTGHYLTDATCSTELSYDLRNLRPQCFHCNINLSGNWIAYEARLVREHGQEYVDELKRRNVATTGLSYRNDWYIAKIEEYKAILKDL